MSTSLRRIDLIVLTPDRGGNVIFRGEVLAAAESNSGSPSKATLYRSEVGKYILHEESHAHEEARARSLIHVFETAHALHQHTLGQGGALKQLEEQVMDEAARKDKRIACVVVG